MGDEHFLTRCPVVGDGEALGVGPGYGLRGGEAEEGEEGCAVEEVEHFGGGRGCILVEIGRGEIGCSDVFGIGVGDRNLVGRRLGRRVVRFGDLLFASVNLVPTERYKMIFESVKPGVSRNANKV